MRQLWSRLHIAFGGRHPFREFGEAFMRPGRRRCSLFYIDVYRFQLLSRLVGW